MIKYFSGFSFFGEIEIFRSLIPKCEFVVSGFSMGAIKALEFSLKNSIRIDHLVLISPAFFMDKTERFINLQLNAYLNNPNLYINTFSKNCDGIDVEKFIKNGTYDELEFLLRYKWQKEDLKQIRDRGTVITVYLGENDKIINSSKALDFFKEFTTIYLVKNCGHIIKLGE